MDEIKRALEILGLGLYTTSKDIKQAYRDLVKVWHPDRFPNDPRVRRKAEEKLKEINQAYEILKGYGPSSREGSHPHEDSSKRPNPSQDHYRGEASEQDSPSQPFEASGHGDEWQYSDIDPVKTFWKFVETLWKIRKKIRAWLRGGGSGASFLLG
ncbi:MAG: DnaJ domain-containing protein [Desulfomonile tiedjei]|uniref:DnaJ domain-containing protein n=1 Tax=Desulfomonile tiedjei TaxID=2358 RepID=A0A9D6Z8G6_9BACT|nr:DnaJ domain-containing protein [Desulfomonile tiedjei]